jgi:hypothetical protein
MRSYETIHPSLDWYKASFCQNHECVEISALDSATIVMRNSARPGEYAYFTREEFDSFLNDAKIGKFDLAR